LKTLPSIVTDGTYPCAEAYAARKKVHDERWHKRKQRDVAVERDLEGIAQRKVTAMNSFLFGSRRLSRSHGVYNVYNLISAYVYEDLGWTASTDPKLTTAFHRLPLLSCSSSARLCSELVSQRPHSPNAAKSFRFKDFQRSVKHKVCAGYDTIKMSTLTYSTICKVITIMS
jgi:hypothetical protein